MSGWLPKIESVRVPSPVPIGRESASEMQRIGSSGKIADSASNVGDERPLGNGILSRRVFVPHANKVMRNVANFL
jgi:hypothetical protein